VYSTTASRVSTYTPQMSKQYALLSSHVRSIMVHPGWQYFRDYTLLTPCISVPNRLPALAKGDSQHRHMRAIGALHNHGCSHVCRVPSHVLTYVLRVLGLVLSADQHADAPPHNSGGLWATNKQRQELTGPSAWSAWQRKQAGCPSVRNSLSHPAAEQVSWDEMRLLPRCS
jgi:hypothetical protein